MPFLHPSRLINATPTSCLCEPESSRRARFVFRHLALIDHEDAVSEAVAAAFASFLRLKARGRNPVRDFPSRMAHWAALVVMDGRHLSGSDVLSQRAQRRHGFTVESLIESKGRRVRESSIRTDRMRQPDAIEEMLRGNTRTPPCEQAVFKIDFANWLAARSHQDRQMIHELSLGERTNDVAKSIASLLAESARSVASFTTRGRNSRMNDHPNSIPQ